MVRVNMSEQYRMEIYNGNSTIYTSTPMKSREDCNNSIDKLLSALDKVGNGFLKLSDHNNEDLHIPTNMLRTCIYGVVVANKEQHKKHRTKKKDIISSKTQSE